MFMNSKTVVNLKWHKFKKNHEKIFINLKIIREKDFFLKKFMNKCWWIWKRFVNLKCHELQKKGSRKNVHQFENGSWKKIPNFIKNAQEKMFMNLETVHEFEMSCISNKIHEKNHQKVGPTQVLWASPGLVLLALESFPVNYNFSYFFEHFHFFAFAAMTTQIVLKML